MISSVDDRPLEAMTPAVLENLERQTVSFLYALWRAMGVKKRVIRVELGNGVYGEIKEVMGNE